MTPSVVERLVHVLPRRVRIRRWKLRDYETYMQWGNSILCRPVAFSLPGPLDFANLAPFQDSQAVDFSSASHTSIVCPANQNSCDIDRRTTVISVPRRVVHSNTPSLDDWEKFRKISSYQHRTPYGSICAAFLIGGGGIFFGAWLSQKFAELMEVNEYFVPDEDD